MKRKKAKGWIGMEKVKEIIRLCRARLLQGEATNLDGGNRLWLATSQRPSGEN